jgi:hypothetical protein
MVHMYKNRGVDFHVKNYRDNLIIILQFSIKH